ncbi:meiosis-specific kinetochore protein isoform X3 [Notamacropus eugenii]|uniref:meiosis-specific kinetochore protein isoform X3 n=1 Tax=Notamacropus eugenii TaxID=9315 RepID=UPI003B67F8EB
MLPQRTYVRHPRRPGRRLNYTPPPPGPSRGFPEPQPRDAPFRGSKGKLQMKILPKLKENVEATQLRESPATKHGMQLNVAHQKKLQKSHINEDSKNLNTLAQKESMTNDDLQGESNPNNTQISSGITSSSDISFSLLRSSDMNFYVETSSFEDSLSSLPSPEIFRGGEVLGINDSTTEDYLKFKNSTFLDTRRAVAIENMQQFSNLSAILDNSIYNILPETEKSPDVKTKEYNVAVEDCFSCIPEVLQTNSSVPIDKKNRGFLTSSPSSETDRFEGQCTASEICCIVKSSPRNISTKMLYCCPEGVRNEPVDKERLKTRGSMNTVESINMQWRQDVTGPRVQQMNSSVTTGEKNMGLLGSSPSTETRRLEVSRIASEICCIVETSPRITSVKMSCHHSKRMSKDIILTNECSG